MGNSRQLVRVYIINQSLHWFIIGMLIPVITLFKLEKGMNLLEIGWIAACYSATVMLLELPTGGLSDALGRKRVYLISLVILFISCFFLLISWNFITLAIGTVLFGLARALSSGSIDAWFVDEYNRMEPDGDLQSKLAKAGIYIPLALGLSALIGGILPDLLGTRTVNLGAGIYSINFIVMGVMLIVQYIITKINVIEIAHTSRSSKILDGFKRLPVVISHSIQYGFKDTAVLMMLLSVFAWGFAFVGLEDYWQPQVKGMLGDKETANTWIYGLLTAGYFLSASVGSLLISSFSSRLTLQTPTLLFLLRLLLGCLFFVLALQNNIPGFAVFYLILFMVNGLAGAPGQALFNNQLKEENRSTMQSLYSFFMQSGALAGGIVHGYVAFHYSVSTAWFAAAAVLALSSFTYLKIPEKISIKEETANV
ncbi:MFS transporter [Paenibacillus alkalitolerans]|uniref:MFS transporter n=1 Tax=Paenibacillus alkalitolerans TaxID=2799335 RepID=UPI0018F43F45|nr:MFS transporter [Paenibacillus alkalitolerans]